MCRPEWVRHHHWWLQTADHQTHQCTTWQPAAAVAVRYRPTWRGTAAGQCMHEDLTSPVPAVSDTISCRLACSFQPALAQSARAN